MHPAGAAEGVASEAARRAIDLPPEEAERVVTRSRSLTALERLAIYNRAYYARLLECLRESYPVLCHALGEDAFGSFALDYLQKYPSRSYTLNDLGANFPALPPRVAAAGRGRRGRAELAGLRHRPGDAGIDL